MLLPDYQFRKLPKFHENYLMTTFDQIPRRRRSSPRSHRPRLRHCCRHQNRHPEKNVEV
jgi:hypothetical protein